MPTSPANLIEPTVGNGVYACRAERTMIEAPSERYEHTGYYKPGVRLTCMRCGYQVDAILDRPENDYEHPVQALRDCLKQMRYAFHKCEGFPRVYGDIGE